MFFGTELGRLDSACLYKTAAQYQLESLCSILMKAAGSPRSRCVEDFPFSDSTTLLARKSFSFTVEVFTTRARALVSSPHLRRNNCVRVAKRRLFVFTVDDKTLVPIKP